MDRKVVLVGPEDVRVVEDDAPSPRRNQAMVRLRAGGICGSDLAAYRGLSPLVTYPRVLGHELLVDVLHCPRHPNLEGGRAVVNPMEPCGICRACRSGRSNCCAHLRVLGVHTDGGLRDTFALETGRLIPVPADLGDDAAILTEPLTIAYHAVQRSGVQAGDRVVVFGAGAIGLLIASILLRARGCSVQIADVDTGRLEIAQVLGATPLPVDRDTLREGVVAGTGGDLADAVFEATGNAACTRLTTDVVAFAGTIVLVGWNKGPVEIDTVTLMRKEVNLLGSRNSLHAFEPTLRLLAQGVLDPALLITHRFDLDHAGEALRTLDDPRETVLKIVLQPKVA